MLTLKDYLNYPDLKIFTPGCDIGLSSRVTLRDALRLDAKDTNWDALRMEQMLALKRQLETITEDQALKKVKLES